MRTEQNNTIHTRNRKGWEPSMIGDGLLRLCQGAGAQTIRTCSYQENGTYTPTSRANGTYTQISHQRHVRTYIAQTIQTHRYHTNGTYTQSHNDAHNTTVRIHPDITQPVHRYHRTVRTKSHQTNCAYTLIAHPDSRQTIHAHRHHTNGTHAQIAHKR